MQWDYGPQPSNYNINVVDFIYFNCRDFGKRTIKNVKQDNDVEGDLINRRLTIRNV